MSWSKNMDWSVYYQIPENLCGLYLNRLGLEKKEPSKAYLDELIRMNQRKIPFETLNSTLLHEPVSIEPEKLVEKVLLKKRGGFCFELNGLFYLLLRALGFQAWLCPGRQLRHKEPCPVPSAHCSILVWVDGREWFCDVGYDGPVPEGSLELKPDVVQTVGKERFYFQKGGIIPGEACPDGVQSGWLTLLRKSSRAGHEDLPLMQVGTIHCYLSDFYGQCMLRSEGDTSYGTLRVSRRTKDGYIDLTGKRLRIKAGDTCTEYAVNDTDLPEILLRYFDIGVQAGTNQ